mmetsp:Transcript_54227/g.65403  ORF Transcript_54227/g.65403 Transcript_54227/m.65403 type:complete len:435 (+) Transcript_54227:2138-3442(+)
MQNNVLKEQLREETINWKKRMATKEKSYHDALDSLQMVNTSLLARERSNEAAMKTLKEKLATKVQESKSKLSKGIGCNLSECRHDEGDGAQAKPSTKEDTKTALRIAVGEMSRGKLELELKVKEYERKMAQDKASNDTRQQQLKNEISSLEDSNSTLIQRKNKLESEIMALANDKEQLTKDNDRFSSRLLTIQETVTELENTVEKKDKQISTLVEDIDKMKSSYGERVNKLEKYVSDMRKNSSESEVLITAIKEKLEKERKRSLRLQEHQEKQAKEIEKYHNATSDLKLKLALLNKRSEELERDLNEKTAEIIVHEAKGESDKLQIESLSATVSELKSECDNLSEEKVKLKDEVTDLEGKLDIVTQKTLTLIEEQEKLEKLVEKQLMTFSMASTNYNCMLQAASTQEQTIKLAVAKHEKVIGALGTASLSEQSA